MKNHYIYMEIALELAARARGRTSPNPMVGAVLVNNGEVVGQGYHARAGAPHAEIMALRDAGDKASGTTLYVTLEPCCHYGRTGPCTNAIIEAGINRVVVATLDPNPRVAGKGIKQLKDAGIEVVSGVMEKQSRDLNEVFNKHITSRLPYVVSKIAMSIDGKIATRTGESQWITGKVAREKGHQFRDNYDAILIGVGTLLYDNPSLTTRLAIGTGRDPIRLVLDSQARTPLNCKMLNQDSLAPTYIIVSKNADQSRLIKLKSAGAIIVCMENDEQGICLKSLLKWLGSIEVTSLMVEGGAGVHGSFFKKGLVDKVYWFIAPKIIGGVEAPGPVGGEGIDSLPDALHLDRIKVSQCGEDILVEGYIKR